MNKARPYFEQRTIYLGCLEEQKELVQELEGSYMAAKSQYANSLRNLELISEDIHRVRSSKNPSASSTPTPQQRQECLGAELQHDDVSSSTTTTATATTTTTETSESCLASNLDELSVQTSAEGQSSSCSTTSPRRQTTGRFRSSLVLDLDFDIDLAENINSLAPMASSKTQPPPPRPLAASKSVDVALKHYDDYQVLDIMPFLEKDKQRQRAKKADVEGSGVRRGSGGTTRPSGKTLLRVQSDTGSSKLMQRSQGSKNTYASSSSGVEGLNTPAGGGVT